MKQGTYKIGKYALPCLVDEEGYHWVSFGTLLKWAGLKKNGAEYDRIKNNPLLDSKIFTVQTKGGPQTSTVLLADHVYSWVVLLVATSRRGKNKNNPLLQEITASLKQI